MPIEENDIEEESNSRQQRGSYVKPTRDNAIAVIKKMIIEDNYSPNEVQELLKIPTRSFKRYLHQAFSVEKEALVESIATTDMLRHVAVVEARIERDRRALIEFARDKTIDPKRLLAITEAYKVASSLNMAALKIHNELLPELFNQRSRLDYSDVIHVIVNGKRMTIKEWTDSLKSQEQEQLQPENNNDNGVVTV
jgi:hypothetical protein